MDALELSAFGPKTRALFAVFLGMARVRAVPMMFGLTVQKSPSLKILLAQDDETAVSDSSLGA